MSKYVCLKNQIPAVFLILVCAIGFPGCAKQPAEVVQSEQTSPVETTQPTNVSEDALTGIWFGSASLNSAKLQEKLFSLPPQKQQMVAAQAQSFLSTIMAIEFRSDGSVLNEVEFQSLDGQLVRDSSAGNWSIAEAKPDGLLVETSETLQNGTSSKTQVFYRFLENGNVAISLPVSSDLEGCETTLVFERRTLESTNVAEAASGTQTK